MDAVLYLPLKPADQGKAPGRWKSVVLLPGMVKPAVRGMGLWCAELYSRGCRWAGSTGWGRKGRGSGAVGRCGRLGSSREEGGEVGRERGGEPARPPHTPPSSTGFRSSASGEGSRARIAFTLNHNHSSESSHTYLFR